MIEIESHRCRLSTERRANNCRPKQLQTQAIADPHPHHCTCSTSNADAAQQRVGTEPRRHHTTPQKQHINTRSHQRDATITPTVRRSQINSTLANYR